MKHTTPSQEKRQPTETNPDGIQVFGVQRQGFPSRYFARLKDAEEIRFVISERTENLNRDLRSYKKKAEKRFYN